jgi:hypothetical protein
MLVFKITSNLSLEILTWLPNAIRIIFWLSFPLLFFLISATLELYLTLTLFKYGFYKVLGVSKLEMCLRDVR